jgi:hypothetical protein
MMSKNMAYNNDAAAVVEAGGPQVIVEAMTGFPKSEDVQDNGCFALGNLAEDSDSTKTVVEAGGAQVIVKAMTEFPKSEKLECKVTGPRPCAGQPG